METETYALNDGSTIDVHVVTEEDPSEVTVIGMQTRKVSVGEVLVSTSRPGVWDVYSAEDFAEMQAQRQTQPVDAPVDAEGDEDVAPFNPTDHTVVDVLEYLDTADDEEVSRVLMVERNGRNRAGIVNR